MNIGLIKGVDRGLHKGVLKGTHPGLSRGLLKGLNDAICLQDPILLLQPSLYLNAYNPDFLTFSGNKITTINRYIDSGLNTNTLGTSEILYNTVDEKPWIEWNNSSNTIANTKWTLGTTSTFAFLHQRNAVHTHYYVVSNFPSDNITSDGNSRFILATLNSGSSVGYSFHLICNADGTRNFTVLCDTGTAVGWNGNFPIFPKAAYGGAVLLSIRVSDPNVVGAPVVDMYINGEQYRTLTLQNQLSTSATSTTAMTIGNRVAGATTTTIPRVRIGEMSIFNAYHDEGTHKSICGFLMKRWNIRYGNFTR